MITNYYGSMVLGSEDIEISVAGAEIIPEGSGRVINFQLLNDDDCHININNSGYKFIRAGQGVAIPVVKSVKIQEAGIEFNWIGIKG